MLNLSDRTLLFTILALVAISVLIQVFVTKEDDASFSISLPKLQQVFYKQKHRIIKNYLLMNAIMLI